MSMQAQNGLSRAAVLSSSLVLAAGFVMFRSVGCQASRVARPIGSPAVEHMSGSKSAMMLVPTEAPTPGNAGASFTGLTREAFMPDQQWMMSSSKLGHIARPSDFEITPEARRWMTQNAWWSTKSGSVVGAEDMSVLFPGWTSPWLAPDLAGTPPRLLVKPPPPGRKELQDAP